MICALYDIYMYIYKVNKDYYYYYYYYNYYDYYYYYYYYYNYYDDYYYYYLLIVFVYSLNAVCNISNDYFKCDYTICALKSRPN